MWGSGTALRPSAARPWQRLRRGTAGSILRKQCGAVFCGRRPAGEECDGCDGSGNDGTGAEKLFRYTGGKAEARGVLPAGDAAGIQ